MKHRGTGPVAILLPWAVCLLAGCQQQMASQPSYHPDEECSFFPDGRADRPLVPGTVARGHLRTDLHLYTGRSTSATHNWSLAAALVGTTGPNVLGAAALGVTEENNYVAAFPFKVTAEVLQHGRDRYMIYCVVCHDALGNGRGKIVERGYTPPPSYHIDRLRAARVGHFFDVITNGYGSMPDYCQQIPPRDRWAIVAYIRALQLSQHYPEDRLPPELRDEWQRQESLTAGGQPR